MNPVIISPDPGTVYTIDEGESIQFECEAYGIPPPMFTFEYEVSISEEMLARISFPDPGMPSVYIIPATGEEVMLSRGIAILANATDGDSGNYTCVANSTTPETDRVTVTLVVQGTYTALYTLYNCIVCSSGKECIILHDRSLLYLCSCSQYHYSSSRPHCSESRQCHLHLSGHWQATT